MSNKILNPWPETIRKNSYCINDAEYNRILKFNDQVKDKDPNCAIDLTMIAEPFFGNKKANVVFLALNPGIHQKSKKNPLTEFDLYNNTELTFKADIVKYHQGESIEFPYYYLDPIYEDYPGNIWIEKKIKYLKLEYASKIEGRPIKIGDFSKELHIKVNRELSNKILYLQYFPYHSSEFKHLPLPYLEVQKYTFQLLAEAVERKAVIVCFRSLNLWNEALKFITADDVMDLHKYRNDTAVNGVSKVITLKNPRNPVLSKMTYNKKGKIVLKGNMEDQEFDLLISALSQKFN